VGLTSTTKKAGSCSAPANDSAICALGTRHDPGQFNEAVLKEVEGLFWQPDWCRSNHAVHAGFLEQRVVQESPSIYSNGYAEP
jgi:hypothetical protein